MAIEESSRGAPNSSVGTVIEQTITQPGVALAKFNEIVGVLGTVEICTCFLILLSGIECAWQTISFVFTTAEVNYECIVPNITKCDPECPQIIYPGVKNDSNIRVEWNLVCEDEIKAQTSQSILLLGVMFGGLFFGHLADQYGRRPCYLASCILFLISGFIVAVAPWYWLFCFNKFFLGIACGGMSICCLVFLVEYVEVQKRDIIVLMFQFPYAVGYSTLPIFAYFVPGWRNLQIATTALGLVFISYFWLLPESPRWLLLMGYIDRCVEELQNLSLNKDTSYNELVSIVRGAHLDLIASDVAKDGTMLDLFKTENMRKKTCILGFAWFSLYFKFYGLSDYVGFIQSNAYLNFGAGSFLMIIGNILAYPVIKLVTRRKALLSSFGLSALFLFIIPIVSNVQNNIVIAVISTIVIALASISFVNIQLFSTELFPTVVRNSGIGFSLCIGRFGSVISPYILNTLIIKYWFPAVVYAVLSTITAFVILLLPETKGKKLPDTIEEGENFGKKRTTTTSERSEN